MFTMKKMTLVISSLTLSWAASARNYGEAGCGLGSMVMGKEGNQILAATTNDTFGSQTFGISTGTSNCVDDGAVAEHRALDLYLESNRVALATESSRGQGESLVALAKLLGCQDSQILGATIQRHYPEVFSGTSDSTEQLSQRVRTLIRNEPKLASGCSDLG